MLAPETAFVGVVREEGRLVNETIKMVIDAGDEPEKLE